MYPPPHHYHQPAYQVAPGRRVYPTRELKDILNNSPSREHGISAEQEQAMMRTAINMIIGAGSKLHMDHLAISTATVYLRRFYAIKSLLKNDYFVISIACLYLAGKVEDSPKSVRDVLYACFEWRFKGQPDLLRKLYDKEFYEAAKERVFTAERSLLYALGFDFNVDNPFEPLIAIFREGPVAQLRESVAQVDPAKANNIGQFSMGLANDSLKTPLCLQYSSRQVAAAVVWLVLTLYRLDADTVDEHGRVWWAAFGVTPDLLEAISGQLLCLYEPEQQAEGQQAPFSTAQQAQFSTAQQVMQGVMDGQLLLYATHTLTAEQHQKLYPPPAPAPQTQAAQLAVWPAPLPQAVPPHQAPAPPVVSAAPPPLQPPQPVAQQQPAPPPAEAQAAAAEGKEEFDEYEELFS